MSRLMPSPSLAAVGNAEDLLDDAGGHCSNDDKLDLSRIDGDTKRRRVAGSEGTDERQGLRDNGNIPPLPLSANPRRYMGNMTSATLISQDEQVTTPSNGDVCRPRNASRRICIDKKRGLPYHVYLTNPFRIIWAPLPSETEVEVISKLKHVIQRRHACIRREESVIVGLRQVTKWLWKIAVDVEKGAAEWVRENRRKRLSVLVSMNAVTGGCAFHQLATLAGFLQENVDLYALTVPAAVALGKQLCLRRAAIAYAFPDVDLTNEAERTVTDWFGPLKDRTFPISEVLRLKKGSWEDRERGLEADIQARIKQRPER